MTDNPAFLWETEALREASERRAERSPARRGATTRWATLRDAHLATGIPTETIRKWARRENVPSYLDQTTNLRMVDLDAVRRRAVGLGRDVRPVRRGGAAGGGESSRDANAAVAPQRHGPAAPPEPAMAPNPPSGAAVAGEGTMIVPIAAWDKMLLQLGNLHEAGQQLAEARERAAKAETEARFLRERLAEMRAELRRAEAAAASPAPPSPAPSAPADRDPEHETAAGDANSGGEAAPPAVPQKLWRYVYEGWKNRRR